MSSALLAASVVAGWLAAAGGGDPMRLTASTAFLATGMAAVLNNHPAASILALAIQDLAVPDALRRWFFAPSSRC